MTDFFNKEIEFLPILKAQTHIELEGDIDKEFGVIKKIVINS